MATLNERLNAAAARTANVRSTETVRMDGLTEKGARALCQLQANASALKDWNQSAFNRTAMALREGRCAPTLEALWLVYWANHA